MLEAYILASLLILLRLLLREASTRIPWFSTAPRAYWTKFLLINQRVSEYGTRNISYIGQSSNGVTSRSGRRSKTSILPSFTTSRSPRTTSSSISISQMNQETSPLSSISKRHPLGLRHTVRFLKAEVGCTFTTSTMETCQGCPLRTLEES